MKNQLLTLAITLGLTAAVSADTIRATVNGMVCGFCATGIEKTFKAQPEVKTVNVDLESKLVTVTMGSYGVGVTRAVGALAEQTYDEFGLCWPAAVAPADVHLATARTAIATAVLISSSITMHGAVKAAERDERRGELAKALRAAGR